jgi:hypothetical protein
VYAVQESHALSLPCGGRELDQQLAGSARIVAQTSTATNSLNQKRSDICHVIPMPTYHGPVFAEIQQILNTHVGNLQVLERMSNLEPILGAPALNR